ncbi:hypothetical protein B4102_3449 [Heyndrickxia sporothermodurans]|uniref:Uncharacterized protein n=1 Tax=Heyndrickxia sporothermodurans TaxID=46224 RepID=A0A150KP89_9BACI|nr:hypothetical protein B4102_3449 [Heyndrickxia sporothermodurans]
MIQKTPPLSLRSSKLIEQALYYMYDKLLKKRTFLFLKTYTGGY